jgi:predicted dehydrogenase
MTMNDSRDWRDVRVLVVGCGSIGRRHARVLQEIGVRDIAVCDPSEPARAAVQADLGLGEGYADYRHALEHGFDAVVLCTPPWLHIAQAKTAIEIGCDVLTEKPLSHNLEGIDDLIATVERHDRILMVAFCMRFHAGLLRVKSLLDEGAIGRLFSCRFEVGEYLPSCRPGVDYRTLFVTREDVGVTIDYIHEPDLAIWLVGQRVRDVTAMTAQLSDLEMAGDDVAEQILRFDDRCMAQIHVDCARRTRRRVAQFLGVEGVIEIDFTEWDNCIIDTYRASDEQWSRQTVGGERDDMFRAEDRLFLERVISREPPALDAFEGRKSLAVVLAAREASLTGRTIELPARFWSK